MAKLNKLIALFAIIAIAYSCQNNSYKKHNSGLQYKFIVDATQNRTPQLGDILLIKVVVKTADNKVIEETDFFKIKLTEPSYLGGAIEDGLALMSVGDSLHIKLNAEDYFTHTKKSELPEGVLEEDELSVAMKLAEHINIKEFEKDQRNARLSAEREEDRQLSEFVKQKNINTPSLLSGMYYIETTKGKGQKATPGKKVVVHYTGSFLNGQIFDSSVERGKPFVFKLGLGQVIQGWDEGISKMNVGGKARLIIPSSLAYGEEAVGPIPPFATLVFDVELLEVPN